MERLKQFTLIIPYYRSPKMLKRHLDAIATPGDNFRVIIVDDGSPEPAYDICCQYQDMGFELYRIKADIPWNREGARNLGTKMAKTKWIVHIDTDHILDIDSIYALQEAEVDEKHWYLFPRYRVGAADETRKKDAIPDQEKYGRIHPHCDSYLCTRDLYWQNGGYNENYSGCLGGGGPFLKRMRMIGGDPLLLPDPIHLDVYTRHAVEDASVRDLSRDKAEFKRRKKIYGTQKPKDILRFDWERQL